MIVESLIIILILIALNIIPIRVFNSRNRFIYWQGIFFVLLFISVWIYKIYSETEMQGAKMMKLKELTAYNKPRKSNKKKVKVKYYDAFEFPNKNATIIDNELESVRESNAILLRVLSIDAIILYIFCYLGMRKHKSLSEYYSKKGKLYLLFIVVCVSVEVFNFIFLEG